MKITRDMWLVAGLVVVLTVLAVITALRTPQEDSQALPELASYSTAPDGANALVRWLERLGYDVVDSSGDTVFMPPPEAELGFMLEPYPGIRQREWTTIITWVQEGRTLIIAGDGPGAAMAFQRLAITLVPLSEPVEQLAPLHPLALDPPLTSAIPLQARYGFEINEEVLPLLIAPGGETLAVSIELIYGRVILLSTGYPLSNQGLKEEENARFVLNLISPVARGSTVWFDEWHHDVRETDLPATGPGQWLRQTPAGQAVLMLLAVSFLAVVLRGQPFGRPVPLPKDLSRRRAMEYVTAIAHLNRRSNQRHAVLSHYHYRLKHGLGRRFRLDPDLPDSEFAGRIGELIPDIDRDDLLRLLTRLRTHVSEAEMVSLAAEVARWLARHGG